MYFWRIYVKSLVFNIKITFYTVIFLDLLFNCITLWIMHIVFCVTIFLTFYSDYHHIHSPTLLIVIWVVPRFLLLWIVLGTFFYISLLNMCKNVLSIHIGDNGHTVSKVITPLYTRPPETRPSSTLGISCLSFLSPFFLTLFTPCQFHRFKIALQCGLDLHFSHH